MSHVPNQSEKSQIINQAKGLAKWLQIDIVIKIFGHVIYEYHFPPKESV